MSDSDTEVERIVSNRPPSSYGSMCSEDHDDDPDLEEDIPPPIVKLPGGTGIRYQRPDSPETGITSVTQDPRSSVRNEGVFIKQNGEEQEPAAAEAAAMDVEEQDSYIAESVSRRSSTMQPSLPEPAQPPPPSVESERDQLSLKYIFTAMLHTLRNLNQMELLCFVRSLREFNKDQYDFQKLEQEGGLDALGVVDRMMERKKKGRALRLAVTSLNDINKKPLASTLEQVCCRALLQNDLRETNKRRYYNLYEGLCTPGDQRFIGQVYVEPPIFVKGRNGRQDTQIRAADIFRPLEGEGRVRVLVTIGVPAVGLTVTLQKFIIDWVLKLDEQDEHDFHYVFALKAQQLRESEQTFLEFLAMVYPEAKNADFLASADCSALFIIDGLQLCRLGLDFQNNPSITDVRTAASTDALLTSLIKGDLLPNACVWITTYSYAARRIPADHVSRVMMLEGFDDARKDEYFTKRTRNPSLGVRVRDHAKSSAVLYDACAHPLFAWIVSLIYERRFMNPNFSQRMAVLTSFYAQYLNLQSNRRIERYLVTRLNVTDEWRDRDRLFLTNMGRLARKMLLEQRDVFYENEATHFGLETVDITERGGLSYQVSEAKPEKGRTFKFSIRGMRDFLAAMYVYVTFRTTGDVLPLDPQATKVKKGQSKAMDLYKPAIERALACADGQLDLFLHFLLGLSAKGTQFSLHGHLLPHYLSEPKGMEEVLKYAKKKIKENAAPDRCRNLDACLIELDEAKSEW